MKRLVTLTAVTLLSIFSMNAEEMKEQISKEQLPKISQDFISKHFASTPVINAVKEIDGRKVEYEVCLNGGVELKFEKSGEWSEVDANNSAVPDTVVPGEILSAIGSKYPQKFIVQIERTKSRWEIELNDGTEVKFNSNFKITDIDR